LTKVQSIFIDIKCLQEQEDPVELQNARQHLQELNADTTKETKIAGPTDGKPHVLTIVPLLM
jgi:hypothetical protein